jgi:hypothetical protein
VCQCYLVTSQVHYQRPLTGPYVGLIIERLYKAAGTFKKKNLVILYDAISCLVDAIGDACTDRSLIAQLVPPLLAALEGYEPRDRFVCVCVCGWVAACLLHTHECFTS